MERHTVPDTRDIPFASPTTGPDEIEAVGRALRAGEVRTGGPISERVEGMLVGATGASFALLVSLLGTAGVTYVVRAQTSTARQGSEA